MEEVTLEDLRQYLKLKDEIKALRAEREAVYVSRPAPSEVKGGRSSVHVPSDPTAAKARRAGELAERLERIAAELEAETERIEEWTLALDDQRVGSAIRMHYIHGINWARVARTVYGYSDKDVCRKEVKRYMERRQHKDE